MTDDTQPEAMDRADWLEAVGGGPSAKRCAALLREQHARIAELESELEAVGAGGVQALSAAPEAIAKLRHLYQNMVNGAVRDTASAKRIAEGLLAPAIEALERATPPAEQQAAPKAAPGEPSDVEIDDFLDSPACITWVIASNRDRYRLLVRAVLAKWAAPQQEAQEPVATLHCNDIGYVWARATEVGTRMRFEQPINLYTAPQPAPDCHHRPPCDECAAIAAQGGKDA